MSVLILQVGQCGNQVGSSIYDTIYNDCFNSNNSNSKENDDYVNESINKYFYKSSKDNSKLESRAIQIDMEEKVVNTIYDVKRSWDYSKRSRYCEKQGAGNNWASGRSRADASMLAIVEETLRWQMERADAVEGVLVTMSVAGGTGSGVGSALCRHLRQEHPKVTVMSHCVWPYSQGEVAVQSYNTLLSVASLLGAEPGQSSCLDPADAVHAVLLHENDLAHSACLTRLGLAKVGVAELNRLISHQLVSVLQPVREARLTLSELALDCVPHPDYRFLRLRQVPFSPDSHRPFATDTWPQLTRHLNQMLVTGSVLEDGLDWSTDVKLKGSNSYLSLRMTARGRIDPSSDTGRGLISWQRLSSPLLSAPTPIWTSHFRHYNRYDKSLSALSNGRDSVLSPVGLERILTRAWSLFASNAYLYQYERFGVHKQHFLDCFAHIEQVIHDYRAL